VRPSSGPSQVLFSSQTRVKSCSARRREWYFNFKVMAQAQLYIQLITEIMKTVVALYERVYRLDGSVHRFGGGPEEARRPGPPKISKLFTDRRPITTGRCWTPCKYFYIFSFKLFLIILYYFLIILFTGRMYEIDWRSPLDKLISCSIYLTVWREMLRAPRKWCRRCVMPSRWGWAEREE